MADETSIADRWLYSVLSNDSTLDTLLGSGDRVWQEQADQGAPMPYVVFQYQGGFDVAGVGPTRIMASLLYLVRVIGTGEFSELEAAADRIDTLLHAKAGEVADGHMFACVREQPFRLIETTDGIVYRHRGGLYRLLAQSA